MTAQDSRLPHYKTVFLSDTHLGVDRPGAEWLALFLESFTCDTLVLLGDMLDGERMMWGDGKFPAEQRRILDALNRHIDGGAKVYYVPGNHDEKLHHLNLYGKTVMGITFVEEYIEFDARGRSWRATHGHENDGHKLHAAPAWFKKLGNFFYAPILKANAALEEFGHLRLGRCFNLAAAIRRPLEKLARTYQKFKAAAKKAARALGHHGPIHGHTHIEDMEDGYINLGSGIEGFTAVVVTQEREFRRVHWHTHVLSVGLRLVTALQDSLAPHPRSEAHIAAIENTWPGRRAAESRQAR